MFSVDNHDILSVDELEKFPAASAYTSTLTKIFQKLHAEAPDRNAARFISAFLEKIDDATWKSISAMRDIIRSETEAEERIDYARSVIEELLTASPKASRESLHAQLADSISQSTLEQTIERDREVFHENYARLKRNAGYFDVDAVAAASGLSKTTIYAIESGRVKPQLRTIEKLALAFGVDVRELLDPASGAYT